MMVTGLDFPKNLRSEIMKSGRIWWGAAALGLCLVGLGAAAAQPTEGIEMSLASGLGFGGPLGHHDGPFARMMTGRMGRLLVLKSELGITDDQRSKLKTIGLSHRNELGPALEKVGGTFRGVRDSVLAENGNEEAIRQAAEAHGKAVGDLAVALSKVTKEGREVLTEEQQTQIKNFIAANDVAAEKMRKEMKEKFGVK